MNKHDIIGRILIMAVALAFVGTFTGFYHIDKARGISVGQSLSEYGL